MSFSRGGWLARRFLRTNTPAVPPPTSKSARRAARRLARSAPPHPVVLIPEPIELILFHTHLRTLLVSAQRVCTSWRDVILHSPRLQRKLFLSPSFSPVLAAGGGDDDDDGDDGHESGVGLEFNPLLVSSFSHFFPAPEDVDLSLPFLQAQGNDHPLGACMRLPMTDMRDGRARHLAFTRRGAS